MRGFQNGLIYLSSISGSWDICKFKQVQCTNGPPVLSLTSQTSQK